MPLYDYQCDTCGHRFEVRQSFKDDPLTSCPECGNRIRRVIHPVGIVFKGSGFYVTDSRKSSPAATPANNADGAAADGDKATKDGGAAESAAAPAASADKKDGAAAGASAAPTGPTKSSGDGAKGAGGASSGAGTGSSATS